MKSNVIISCLFIFLATNLAGQEMVQHTFELSWGIAQTKRQDLTISPMIHQGWSPFNFGAEYRRCKNWIQEVGFHFGQFNDVVGETYDFTSFFSDEVLSTHPHMLTTVDIQYAIGKEIMRKDQWHLEMGAGSTNRLMTGSYTLGNFNSLAYYFNFGLDLWSAVTWQINESGRFMARIDVPVLSWNARCDHLWHTDDYLTQTSSHKALTTLGEFIKDGQIQSWGKSQGLNFDLLYLHELNEAWSLGIRYRSAMNFNQDPNPFAQRSHGFFITGQFKI